VTPALSTSRIVVNSDIDALAQVLDWFAQFNAPPLTYEVWWFCQLVLDEGFTNAVRHAHRNLPPTTPITVEVQVFTDRIEMRIWDQGAEFDLNRKLQELDQMLQDPEPEGGMGLVFLQKFADEVDYQRHPERQQNCLFLRKNLVAVASA